MIEYDNPIFTAHQIEVESGTLKSKLTNLLRNDFCSCHNGSYSATNLSFFSRNAAFHVRLKQ